MSSKIKQVTEFHKASGAFVGTEPSFPDKERVRLRVELIREEAREFAVACQQGNFIEAVDALCDIQYVLTGTIIEFGLQEKFDALFTEVHESNMSKFDSSTYDAQRSCEKYIKEGTDAWYKLVGGKHVIRRTSDDKILKGLKFKKPDLKRIIESK